MLLLLSAIYGGVAAASQAAQDKFDWRDVNGSNWLNPVHDGAPRDQRAAPPASWGPPYTGGCDACWAFSSMDVLAARIYIKSNRAIKALPATNFLYVSFRLRSNFIGRSPTIGSLLRTGLHAGIDPLRLPW